MIILSVLFFSSAIMCFTLVLAWQHFGRERYVLLLAISYGVAVLQWIFNSYGLLFKNHFLMFLAAGCVLVSSSIMVIAARQRAHMPIRWWPFALGGGLATIGSAVSYGPMGTMAMQGIIENGYASVMMAAAAFAIWPKGRTFRAPEMAYCGVLVVFSVFQAVLAGVSLSLPDAEMSVALTLYREIVGIGLPAIYVASGVTAIVVIAGDIALQLRTLVSYDQLTGLLNRRGVEEAAARAIANARRHNRTLAGVICDIDSFKSVNDGYGHIAGDEALRAFAQVLLGAVRQGDIAARFGGDEFFILLLDASQQEAAEVMERVRVAIAMLAVDCLPQGSISASFGVTELAAGDSTLDDLVTRADHALYESKQQGRNRVIIWGHSAAATPMVNPFRAVA